MNKFDLLDELSNSFENYLRGNIPSPPVSTSNVKPQRPPWVMTLSPLWANESTPRDPGAPAPYPGESELDEERLNRLPAGSLNVAAAKPLERTRHHIKESDAFYCSGLKATRPPASNLYLCKNCYNAVKSLVREETAVHIGLSTCNMCRGTHTIAVPSTNTHNLSPSSRQSTTSSRSAEPRPSTKHHTNNRIKKQPRVRSSIEPLSKEKSPRFYCRANDCNRGVDGIGFTRKDNRNVHERSVHNMRI